MCVHVGENKFCAGVGTGAGYRDPLASQTEDKKKTRHTVFVCLCLWRRTHTQHCAL